MKDREIYSDLRIFPPFAVRIDGRGFHRVLGELELEKPYDERFAHAMADSVESLFKESGLNPLFAFIFSDEINLFFYEMPYNNRIEKIDSIIPSFISSALTIKLDMKKPISFDGRVILLGKEDIYRYLLWRQSETWRNHVSSYGYYTLLKSGMTEKEAAERLKNMRSNSLHELVFQHGINLAETPGWQRCGILIYREKYYKHGYDPIRKIDVTTQRTKVIQEWATPIFRTEDGRRLVEKIIGFS
ncbi:MAG: tRNA 5'-guanylyltransferase [Candidatus Methanoperedens sp.]|nr:tRNA 5'-guanylyltransferase [Candidatus Methanoperedens sp.]MCE8424434.1 tRNA 5'-guanylyltransferase [Candidatus Methanoperedens sp.]MCE8427015.1 tRNA 5'-guanylyltransferase [Candidatus Methanoperedens sp.]